MQIDQSKSTPDSTLLQSSNVEADMAGLVLQLNDEVSRAKMATFLHFAQDRSQISVHLEPSRDHGLRFILSCPFTRA